MNSDPAVRVTVEDFLFQKVVEMKGSISAEHGLGFVKAKYLSSSKPKNVVEVMKTIKENFDPNGIMNPYKVFPWNVTFFQVIKWYDMKIY